MKITPWFRRQLFWFGLSLCVGIMADVLYVKDLALCSELVTVVGLVIAVSAVNGSSLPTLATGFVTGIIVTLSVPGEAQVLLGIGAGATFTVVIIRAAGLEKAEEKPNILVKRDGG